MPTSFRAVLAKKPTSSGKYTIKICALHNGVTTLVNSPYKATRQEVINSKPPRLKPNSLLCKLVDDYVESLNRIAQITNESEIEGMTPGQAYKYILQKRERFYHGTKKKNFSLDFPSFYKTVADAKKDSTRRTYNNALKAFNKFMGKEKYDINEITSSLLTRYEDFLIKEYSSYTKTIPLYFGCLSYAHKRARAHYNEEENDVIYINNPFQYFHPQKKPVSKQVLPASRELIQYLIDHRKEFNNDERKAADLWLLIFSLQGMNVADMLKAAAPVNGVITFYRSKTMDNRPDKALTKVKIHDCIRPLYEIYKDPSGKSAFGWKDKYKTEYFHIQASKWIKALRARLKIEPQFRKTADGLRYGSARHSYATHSRSLGIDKGIINDGLSHIDREMKITDIYIEKDWELIWDANKKMLETFDWSKLNPTPKNKKNDAM